MAEPQKLARCAVYTRKSTEHNLDLEFNSLHAQREACEAYIKSQAHEGWRPVPDRYDDGGISGGSLDRPALQNLLSAIEARQIDIIVVYKVDRLTRSLTDFAKLVELFDRHGVSFVSITQAFNTTTSMGRLTLNVLLSFAQFEREVIGERVRDKIAASKRKGLWMGGPVPLGYINQSKKLVIVPEEAETVRMIFRRYLELGAIGPLLQELDRLGIKTKHRPLSSGRVIGGGRFGKGGLNHFLKNRCYIGEIEHRGEIHAACHEPILDRELFDAVQARLESNAVERKLHLRADSAVLTGKIYDDRGNRMGSSHTVKNGVRYRYYVSRAILERRPHEAGSVGRIPAGEVEALVNARLQDHCENLSPGAHLDHVVITAKAIEMYLAEQDGHVEDKVLSIPWTREPFTAPKGISHMPRDEVPAESHFALLSTIAKARDWIADLIADHTSIAEIAEREGKSERYIRLLLPLAFSAPAIVLAAAEGKSFNSRRISEFASQPPCSWAAQSKMIQ